MKHNIPKLNISNLSESSSEEGNSVISNMTIKYKNITPNNFTNSDELKYYNKIFSYKKSLALREIHYYMTDEDLIALSHNDNQDPLYLRITYSANLKTSAKDLSKDSSKDSSRESSKSPKSKKNAISDRVNNRSRSLSCAKTITRAKTDDTTNSKTFLCNIVIYINNIEYKIGYKNTTVKYNLFKIYTAFERISCTGLDDNQISSDILAKDNYDTLSVPYNNIKYDIIYIIKFKDFLKPMYISSDKNITLTQFVESLQSIMKLFTASF